MNNNWWAPAVEVFSEVSTYIVVPIVVALILGKFLDGYFDTRPIIFLALAGVGFLVSGFGIYRVVKRYIEKLKDLDKNN